MATGDLASTGLNTTDLTNLLGLVSPPGSNVKNVGATDTTTTDGATKTSVKTDPESTIVTTTPTTTTQEMGATHSSSTVQNHVDKAGVDFAIQQILEGSQGLAATASASHLAGGYNQATQMLLNNDLAVRTAGTVAQLNKSVTTTNDTDAVVNTIVNSGNQTVTQTNGRNVTTTTDPVTHEVKTTPYSVSTNQTAQVSGNVAAGIAAGTLAYNALGSLVNAATGTAIKNVKDLFTAQGIDTSKIDQSILNAPAIGDAKVDQYIQANLDDIAKGTYNLDINYDELEGAGDTVGGIGDIFSGVGGGGSEGGGGGIDLGTVASVVGAVVGWIVCTELVRQKRFNIKYYVAGAKVFNSYSEIGKIGYYLWAIPCVNHLRKYPNSWFSKVLENVFNWRAEYIAHTLGVKGASKNKKGMVVSSILYPTCWILGHTCYLLNIKRDYHVVYSK